MSDAPAAVKSSPSQKADIEHQNLEEEKKANQQEMVAASCDDKKEVLFVLDGFIVERDLGSDPTGSIYAGTAPNGQKVCLKVLVKDSCNPHYANSHQNMMIERKKLLQRNHPHIMRIVGAKIDQKWEQKGQLVEGDYLALEMCLNDDLFEYVEKGAFSEAHTKRLFMQMLAGLTYMY